MELGQQIKQARESKNLSQEELAAQLGVSRQAVSKWENDSAVPQGLNRDMLSQILGVEFSMMEEEPVKKRRGAMWLGWALAAVLLCVSIGMGICLFFPRTDGEPVAEDGQWTAEASPITQSDPTPVIKSVTFYDRDQDPVGDVALWYNAAEIDSILIQWEGGTPDNIKVFYTPGGTETQEQTQLLLTKSISDGDTLALLSADALGKITMGHVYFELDFGPTDVTSEVYNIMFDADTLA